VADITKLIRWRAGALGSALFGPTIGFSPVGWDTIAQRQLLESAVAHDLLSLVLCCRSVSFVCSLACILFGGIFILLFPFAYNECLERKMKMFVLKMQILLLLALSDIFSSETFHFGNFQ
jgi:hypothetical protein